MSDSHRMRLTRKALEARDEATAMLLGSKAALCNAEVLEDLVCKGTDAEVIEACLQLDALDGRRPETEPS